MSMVNVKDTDDLMQCPYDPAHRVKAIRYTRHIIKCQRNATTNLVPCPFNHQHRIPVDERAKHMIVCPDRVVIERDVFRNEDNCGDLTTPLSAPPTVVNPEEDWDAACCPGEGPAYNPYKRMNKVQFQNPSILSSLKPADKRAYRKGLQTRGFGVDEEEDSFDDSMEVLPILGLKKLVFLDEDVKGFRPRPSPRKTVPDSRSMSAHLSQPSGVTSDRYSLTTGPSSVSVDSISIPPQSCEAASQSFSSGPQSYSSGPRSFSTAARSITNGRSSLHDSSFISNVSSVGYRSDFVTSSVRSAGYRSDVSTSSVRSSDSSVAFSLRGKGRGLRFEKHLSDTN